MLRSLLTLAPPRSPLPICILRWASTSHFPSSSSSSSTSSTSSSSSSHVGVSDRGVGADTLGLMGALELEVLDLNLFRSKNPLWTPPGSQAVFGGQVIGQCMSAAQHSLKQIDRPSDQFDIHSIHAYFLRHGDGSRPILYTVRCTRNGKSFCSRAVEASQGGNVIFTAQMSFQLRSPSNASQISHAAPMPQAPDPLSCPSSEDLINEVLLDPNCPPYARRSLVRMLQQVAHHSSSQNLKP
jgi:acyl-CoA thioesterase II